MKKTKVLALVLIALLTFGFFACKNTSEPTKQKTGSEPTAAPEYDLTGAVSYLKNMYQNLEGKETPADFDVTSQVLIKGNKFTVEWSIKLPEGSTDVVVKSGETTTTIDVNEKAEDKVEYTLTAKITAPDKNSAEISFKLTLPKYNMMSWDEYMAAEKGASIVISGVVTGKVWANATSANVYMQDEDGGYYVYGYACDQANFDAIKVGAEYEVSGIKDVYYGTAEIKDAVLTLVKEGTAPAAKDITAIWEAAPATNDPSLSNLLAQYVTIKNVEMVNITNDGKYINFKRADGMTTYVYISSSSNFVTAEEIAQLNEKCIAGRMADITGFVSLYNGAAYIIPDTVDSITLLALPEKTAEEKVADAVELVNALKGTIVETDLELPKSAYDDVEITYQSDDTSLLSDDGKIVSYPMEATEVNLLASISCGEVSEDVTINLTVAALSKTNIADLDWSDADSTVIIEGKIISAAKNKDAFVADETGVCYVYTKLPEEFAVGDSVRVIGKLTVYGVSKNQVTKELVASSFIKLEEEAKILDPVKVDIADLAKPLYSTSVDDEGALAMISRYQGLLYEITGYVRVKQSGSYTNVYIASENSDEAPCVMYHYSNSADDIAAVQALDGKLVTFVAPMFDYALSYGGWRIGPRMGDVTEVTEAPALTAKNTCLELYSLEDNAEVEVVGTVLHMYAGNGFILNDGTAGIYVYDKSAPIFQAGDVVRVSGVRGNYNGVAEVTSPKSFKLEKIQEGYEIPATEITLDAFLALDGTDPANFGVAFRMDGTLVVGSYINLKTGEDETTNLYFSADEKELFLALLPEGVTEVPVNATFITYQYKNGAFYVFMDLGSCEIKLGE